MKTFKNNVRALLHFQVQTSTVIYQLHGFKRDTTSISPCVVFNLSFAMVKGFITSTKLSLASLFPSVNIRDLQRNTLSLQEE